MHAIGSRPLLKCSQSGRVTDPVSADGQIVCPDPNSLQVTILETVPHERRQLREPRDIFAKPRHDVGDEMRHHRYLLRGRIAVGDPPLHGLIVLRDNVELDLPSDAEHAQVIEQLAPQLGLGEHDVERPQVNEHLLHLRPAPPLFEQPGQLFAVSQRRLLLGKMLDDERAIFRFVVRRVRHVVRGGRTRIAFCVVILFCCADVSSPNGISQCRVFKGQCENGSVLGVQAIYSEAYQRADESAKGVIGGR